ncbi:hypothetical protein PSHT_05801 [Puccinia striiformis]|uniref:Uncharacterized protein n=1 Tax=Puccinia striiformis TaxID=27350 RepID=A0A2S4W9K5_9BASI|nr:hypothetical protein PSHT_05801 [Puccinia striiformis]
MNFTAESERQPFKQVFIKLEGLSKTETDYLSLQEFLDSIQSDPAIAFPQSTIVELVQPKSDQRSSSHAIIRLVRPAEIPSERWLAELLGACHRLKDARLSMAPAPPRHLTTIEPVLLCAPPSSAINLIPPSLCQPLPMTAALRSEDIAPNFITYPPSKKPAFHKKRGRRSSNNPRPPTSHSISSTIEQESLKLAKIKESQAILLAAKKLEKERSALCDIWSLEHELDQLNLGCSHHHLNQDIYLHW